MKRALIIGEEAAVRDALARFLSDDGYAVRTAESPDSALTILRRELVDVVVADVGSRVDDLTAMVATLRSAAGRPHLACVMLVHAATSPGSMAAVTTMTKPIRLPELRAVLVAAAQRGMA